MTTVSRSCLFWWVEKGGAGSRCLSGGESGGVSPCTSSFMLDCVVEQRFVLLSVVVFSLVLLGLLRSP